MALSLDEALGLAALDADEESIHIDISDRQVIIPDSQKLFGVESDDAVEVKHFVVDGRYADDGKDLSALAWRINYRNANGDKAIFPVTKVTAGDDSIEFDWIIRRSVVAYKGSIDFVVCAFGTTSDKVITPEWNSAIGHGEVLEGLEVESEEVADDELLDELKNLLAEIKTASDATFTNAKKAEAAKDDVVTNATAAVNAKNDAETAAANAKKSETNAKNSENSAANSANLAKQAINANNIAAMQNTNALQTQLSDCCCQNKQGQAQIQYDLATNTCAITNAIAQQTQTIMQNDNANYRQLHDEIVANQIAAKDDTIAQLRSRLAAADLAASQQAQNAYLVNQLRPPVTPSYIVTNPYAGTGTLPCQTAGCCGVSA